MECLCVIPHLRLAVISHHGRGAKGGKSRPAWQQPPLFFHWLGTTVAALDTLSHRIPIMVHPKPADIQYRLSAFCKGTQQVSRGMVWGVYLLVAGYFWHATDRRRRHAFLFIGHLYPKDKLQYRDARPPLIAEYMAAHLPHCQHCQNRSCVPFPLGSRLLHHPVAVV